MNSFGRIFRVSIFGESHGDLVGVLIDGCPPGIELKPENFEKDLLRRKPNQSGTTQRIENDKPIIKSGVFYNKTTGAPILIYFENENIKSNDYDFVKDIPRPGHSDFTARGKYNGFNDYRGGGHFSGRLTVGLVAAGVIAKKIIQAINIKAGIIEVGGSQNIEQTVKKAMEENDSIGGVIECRVQNVPIGLGEPFFDSLESVISHIVFSIPAIKGIEFGSGFESAKMKGSDNNDMIINANGTTKTNNSGGINGGISNGNELVFRVAVKPTSSIGKMQKTYNFKNDKIDELRISGRHDTCIALRMPVIIESVVAIVLSDLLMIKRNME